MSGFYGGSSIIKGGKFASHDPADDGLGNTLNKKSISALKVKKVGKSQAKQAALEPKKILEGARKALLHYIIDQSLFGREEVKIPRNTHPQLVDQLNTVDTPLSWAKSQPEFNALRARKQKQKSEQKSRQKLKADTSLITVEVQRKKGPKSKPFLLAATEPELLTDKLYQVNRMTLIRTLVDQMIKHHGLLSVPRLDGPLFEEVQAAGSPLFWLKAQPEYEAVFKDRYMAKQNATSPSKKKSGLPRRKNKKSKKTLIMDRDQAQNNGAQGKPKRKQVRQCRDPHEKLTKPVKPLSDVPVSYILTQLKNTSDNTLNVQKIDWDMT